MKLNSSHQPTPSDFGDFVYCAAKWRYKNDISLEAAVEENRNRNGHMGRESSLSIGQKNEEECVKWVTRYYFNQNPEYKLVGYQYSEMDILFNGTGKESSDFLTSMNLPLDITMLAKPDLILRKYEKNFLFEFKAVSRARYLELTEFDSIHAQVWCYTHIKEFQMEKFVLFRYFESPFFYPPVYKNISPTQLDDAKFAKTFELYVKALSYLKEGDIKSAKPIISSRSKHSEYNKCSKCEFKKLNICSYHRYGYWGMID